MNPNILAQLRLLSQEEIDAGFRRFLVGDPEANLSDPDALVLVVGYILSSSEMIFKTTDSDGETIAYKHRQFGAIGNDPNEKPRWHPIGSNLFEKPGEAVQQSQFDSPGRVVYKVKPFDFVHEDFNG